MTRSPKWGTSQTRPGIPRPGGAVTAGLIVGALALLATARGTGPAASGIAVPSGAEPAPQDVHALPHTKLPPGTLGTSCQPKGSLRPAGPLPAPGHMPAGSTMAAIAKRGYLRVGVDQKLVDFSTDYFNAHQELLVPKHSPVTGPGDLHGKKVCADAGTTGQTELADAIQDGLAARRAGDLETATAKLGRAVALAHASGEEETARLLAGVVDVVDPVTGTIQLKAKVRDVDEMILDVESTKTVRVKR
jgi:hypothetical protein